MTKDYSTDTELHDRIFRLLEEMIPDTISKYNELQRARCYQDIIYHLEYLHTAVWTGSPALFLDYVEWAEALFHGLGLPEECLTLSLHALRTALIERDDKESITIIDQGINLLKSPRKRDKSYIISGDLWEPVVQQFISSLLMLDRSKAFSLVQQKYEEGRSIRDIYLKIFEPALHETGRLWQTQKISIAQEHFCTSAIQQMIAQFYPVILSTPKTGKKVVATCVAGELHEVGVRMVADFFEMAGWESIYLGANIPPSSVISILHGQRYSLLAISCTMTFHLNFVYDLIKMVRSDESIKDSRILVGGYPFRTDEGLFIKIGADGYAKDAENAVIVGEGLLKKA